MGSAPALVPMVYSMDAAHGFSPCTCPYGVQHGCSGPRAKDGRSAVDELGVTAIGATAIRATAIRVTWMRVAGMRVAGMRVLAPLEPSVAADVGHTTPLGASCRPSQGQGS